jgi:hypothetical protein
VTATDPTQLPAGNLSRLRGYQNDLDSASVSDVVDPRSVNSATDGALAAIDGALAVPPPEGSPAAIGAKATAYNNALQTLYANVIVPLADVAQNTLPAAWRGGVAQTAGQAVSALNAQANAVSTSLPEGASYLQELSRALGTAQPLDLEGRAMLQSARSTLEVVRSSLQAHPSGIGGWAEAIGEAVFFPMDMAKEAAAALEVDSAIKRAREGVGQMVSAASTVYDAVADWRNLSNADPNAASGLEANPTITTVPGLNALDMVTLANTDGPPMVPGGTGDPILYAGVFNQAVAALTNLPPGQQAEFDSLLAQVKSPEAAASLLSSLDSGYTVAQLKQQVDTGQVTIW